MKKQSVFVNAVHAVMGIMILCAFAASVQAADPFTVGESWTYQHEGAVPMRPPDFTINGNRTREVLAVRGDGDDKRWVIQELWGDDDQWGGKQIVNSNRMYDKIEVGDDRTMDVTPGYPYDSMLLKPGEEKTVEAEFHFGEDRSFPMKLVAKRLDDETIKTPAGEYKDCIHVKYDESFSFTGQNGDKIEIKTSREHWYHPSVNGLVKEVYTSTGPDGQTRTGTSELITYSKEKK
ncbi:MAG: hypothetical protein GC154_18900 [bacterium]|nr:hypothetical protein [bacterium]